MLKAQDLCVVQHDFLVVREKSLEAFKARLDVALGCLVWWLVTLHIAGGLKRDDHCGPFQPRPFYDSMKINCLLWHVNLILISSATTSWIKKSSETISKM